MFYRRFLEAGESTGEPEESVKIEFTPRSDKPNHARKETIYRRTRLFCCCSTLLILLLGCGIVLGLYLKLPKLRVASGTIIIGNDTYAVKILVEIQSHLHFDAPTIHSSYNSNASQHNQISLISIRRPLQVELELSASN